MDLVYLFRVLLKKKWIIIGSGIIAGAIAWYFTRNEGEKYRSVSRVSTGFAVPDEIKIDGKYELYDAEVKFNNVITTWTSPSVLSLLSYQLILHDLTSPTPFRRLKKEQLESAVYKSINIEEAKKVFQNKLDSISMLTSYKPEEKKLLELLNAYGYGYNDLGGSKLSVTQVPRTDYIELSSSTEHPDLSAYIINESFNQFLRYYRGTREKHSQESVDTLKSIMEKKKQEFDLKNRIRIGIGAVDANQANSSTLGLISELEKKMEDEKNKQTDASFDIRKIDQKLADLGGSSSTANPNNNEELVIARKAMNEAYSEYLKTNDKNLLNKYNQLKAEYNLKYSNSKVAVTDKTEETRQKLLQDKNDLNVDIDASKAKISSLQASINALKGHVNSTSSQDASAQSIEEEVKLAEREYLDAKGKYNTAYDMSSSAVNNFKQLQLAQPAIGPEPSKRKLTVIMAAMVASISAVLIIMLLTYLDSSIKTPTIFSKVVNLKLISMVNFMNLKKKDLKDLVAGTAKVKGIEQKRHNVFRESIRKLRYEIEKSGKKVFLFTSTKKGQGKTTLIMALSYSMSLSKKKVLIVDTNFCNNDLTVRLDATPVLETFSDFENRESMVKQIKALSKDIGVGSVFAIGSEGGDYTPSEILPRENLLQHLHELTPEFDYIFLEGPPLNDFSDSRELLQYVDGVVAIFSATHIIKQIDKESISFFKELDGKLIGAVLNMVDLKNVNAI